MTYVHLADTHTPADSCRRQLSKPTRQAASTASTCILQPAQACVKTRRWTDVCTNMQPPARPHISSTARLGNLQLAKSPASRTPDTRIPRDPARHQRTKCEWHKTHVLHIWRLIKIRERHFYIYIHVTNDSYTTRAAMHAVSLQNSVPGHTDTRPDQNTCTINSCGCNHFPPVTPNQTMYTGRK